jgi:hypothetical protein
MMNLLHATAYTSCILILRSIKSRVIYTFDNKLRLNSLCYAHALIILLLIARSVILRVLLS